MICYRVSTDLFRLLYRRRDTILGLELINVSVLCSLQSDWLILEHLNTLLILTCFPFLGNTLKRRFDLVYGLIPRRIILLTAAG